MGKSEGSTWCVSVVHFPLLSLPYVHSTGVEIQLSLISLM